MKKLLFTFEGRINRKPFWLGILVLGLLSLICFLIYMGVVGFDTVLKAPKGSRADAIVMLIITLLLFAPSLALMIKRLHDLGKTGWWNLILMGPGYAYIFGDAMGVSGGLEVSNWFDYSFGGVYFLVSIWSTIWLGFFTGTTGKNAYGPDPLDRSDKE